MKKITFNKDLIIYLVLFTVIFFITFIIADFFIRDFIAVNVFQSSQFSQFILENFSNYNFIFVSLSIAPYASFVLTAGIFGMAFGKGKYQVGRSFWIIIISLLLAISIHLLYLYQTITQNIDWLLYQSSTIGSIFDEGSDQSSIWYVFIHVVLQKYQNTHDIQYLITYASMVRFVAPKMDYAPLIINASWYIFGYFMLFFIPMFILLNKSCDCIGLRNEKIKLCSKREIWVMLTLAFILTLPVINSYQVYTFQNQNFINWDKYYDPSNLNTPLNASAYSIYNSYDTNLFGENLSAKLPISTVNDNYTIDIYRGMRYEIGYNGSEYVSDRIYPFPKGDVEYLSAGSMWLYTQRIHPIPTDFGNNASNYPFEILNDNYTNLWNKLDFYVYVMNENGSSAIGYRLTNNASTTTRDYSNYTIYNHALQKDITIQTYNVNISAFYDTTDNKTKIPYNYDAIINEFSFLGATQSLTGNLFGTNVQNFGTFYTDQPLLVVPLSALIGYFPIFMQGAKYMGVYLHIAENASTDFNGDGNRETIFLTDASVFCGNKKDSQIALYNMEIFDITYIAIGIAVIALFTFLDSKDKTYQEQRASCNLRTFADSEDYKYRKYIVYKEKD